MPSIVIVEDHEMVRDGLEALLASVPGFAVVGTASGIRAAIGILGRVTPDVLLVDLCLQDGHATEILRHVRRSRCKSDVVIMTGHADPFAAAEAFKEGARGYVLKGEHTSELFTAIEAVAAGKKYVSPAVTALSHGRHGETALDKLSRRESEIFRMVVTGSAPKEIARRLFISPKTVETHRSNISRKLSVRTSADLTRFAAELGIAIAPRAGSFADREGLEPERATLDR